MGTSDIFKHFNILRLEDIYKYFASIHMYKLLIMNDNPSLLECIDVEYRDHLYETRYRDLAIVPRPRLEIEKMNFKYNFITIWNELPGHIVNIRSIDNF